MNGYLPIESAFKARSDRLEPSSSLVSSSWKVNVCTVSVDKRALTLTMLPQWEIHSNHSLRMHHIARGRFFLGIAENVCREACPDSRARYGQYGM